MLKDIGVQNDFSAQGGNIKEIDEALATASNKGTGNVGFPEYVGAAHDTLVLPIVNCNNDLNLRHMRVSMES